MITKLELRNFKSIENQTYSFTDFDLLVGMNNSGKSTILQALAIWQFCVDEFSRMKRTGGKGTQVILPNFTALPVPEFNLLWRERYDRRYPVRGGRKIQEYILIEICVTWKVGKNEHTFGVKLRYATPQTIYAIPSEGWDVFKSLRDNNLLPVIAYVPPFSGLEPFEQWKDDSVLKQQVGKAQPGSVLRNLLLRVCESSKKSDNDASVGSEIRKSDWNELSSMIKLWFSTELIEPKYEHGKDVNIICDYKQDDRSYDIISGGSGFHQVLTLLAFLYGSKPAVILLDEPDAHLHVNLQRELLDFFKRKAIDNGIQFLIATHAEEFGKGVPPNWILSLLRHVPSRIDSTTDLFKALSDITNNEITQLLASPYILYVEGESDERILRAWAAICDKKEIIGKVYFKIMGGGNKTEMKTNADNHFRAINQIIPGVRRLMLFDYDTNDTAFHPLPDNQALFEWKRKNIESYLLIPDAWERAARKELHVQFEDDLFFQPVKGIIDNFFKGQNLTLPPGSRWKTLSANIFEMVDGKGILFEKEDSLFQLLARNEPSVKINPEKISAHMVSDEIHDDISSFFNKLNELFL